MSITKIDKQMKYIIKNWWWTGYVTLLTVCLLTNASCTREQAEVQSSVDRLINQEEDLQTNVQELQEQCRGLKKAADEYAVIALSKGNPLYLLTIKSKKSSFSLDIGRHMKDSMNAFDFTIPVDKDFYNSVSVGTNLADQFVWGSSLGSVKLTVIRKVMQAR